MKGCSCSCSMCHDLHQWFTASSNLPSTCVFLSSLSPGHLKPNSDNNYTCDSPGQDGDVFSSTSSPPLLPTGPRGPSISISVAPCSHNHRLYVSPDDTPDVFTQESNSPPSTQTSKTRSNRTSHSSPPPPRKLLQLFPNLTMTRSKSHESQLANRIEEPTSNKWVFKWKLQLFVCSSQYQGTFKVYRSNYTEARRNYLHRCEKCLRVSDGETSQFQ